MRHVSPQATRLAGPRPLAFCAESSGRRQSSVAIRENEYPACSFVGVRTSDSKFFSEGEPPAPFEGDRVESGVDRADELEVMDGDRCA